MRINNILFMYTSSYYLPNNDENPDAMLSPILLIVLETASRAEFHPDRTASTPLFHCLPTHFPNREFRTALYIFGPYVNPSDATPAMKAPPTSTGAATVPANAAAPIPNTPLAMASPPDTFVFQAPSPAMSMAPLQIERPLNKPPPILPIGEFATVFTIEPNLELDTFPTIFFPDCHKLAPNDLAPSTAFPTIV